MATAQRRATKPTGADLKAAPALRKILRQSQANATVMYLNSKRYHWFTFGPAFRDVHLFWDEVAAAALAEIDPLAERNRMLDGDPLSTPKEIEAACTVVIADGKPSIREMFEEGLSNERLIIKEMRAAAKTADDAGDPGTNDLFSGLVQAHEKYAWFITEFLRQDDGMQG